MPVSSYLGPSANHKNNRNVGLLLLEGALVDEATEHVVTCGLDSYAQYMKQVYPDWQEFTDWLEDRYWLHQGYRGGVPAKWWVITQEPGQP
jgi:hypothetical protein